MNKRIEYIDALRGFSMILIVCWHIDFFSLQHTSLISQLIYPIRMPLFFFISGFFAYNANRKIDNLSSYIYEILKKGRIQLVSTLLFGGLFTYIIYKQNFIDFLSMPLKNGYWFTIALFFMFFIYYSLIYLTKRYQCCYRKSRHVKIEKD